MAQPTPFEPSFNFTDWQTAHPSDPLPGDSLDLQLNSLKTFSQQVCNNLALIQRDDGALANNIVTLDSLSSSLAVLMGLNGYTVKGAWVTATAYAVGNVISTTSGTYVCAIAHTSGTFATDYTNGKWLLLATTGASSASSFTVTGSVTPANGMYLPAADTIGFAAGSIDVLRLAASASAVNYFRMLSSATGVALALQAQGPDTNINIALVPKGTGKVIAPELDLTTPLALTDGGTGAGTAAAARTALAAAASGANSDVTSLTALTSINGGSVSGLKNAIINGGCQVAQRGSTTAVKDGFIYGGVDRIFCIPTEMTTATGAIYQFTGVPTATSFAAGATLTTTGTGRVIFGIRLESRDCFRFNSKTVTLSALVNHNLGSAINVAAELGKANAVDNFAGTTTLGTGALVSCPSGVPTRVFVTATLGASDATNGLQPLVIFQGVTSVTSKDFWISELQLVEGSVVTTFEPRPFALELSLCQRYYEKSFPLATAPAQGVFSGGGQVVFPQGVAASTLQAIPSVQYKAQKFGQATVVTYSPFSASNQPYNPTTGAPCTGATIINQSSNNFAIRATMGAGTAVGDRVEFHWVAESEL